MAAPSPILEKLKGLVSGFVWALWIPRSFGMKFLRSDTDRALEVYRRLVRGAEEADRALFDYVVEHEMAIREFAEMELAGRGRQSIERAAALIA